MNIPSKSAEYCNISIIKTCESLKIDTVMGLGHEEAERRRTTFGLNEISQQEQDPIWKKFLSQFQ
jgi:Ca2+-transporting ATPase